MWPLSFAISPVMLLWSSPVDGWNGVSMYLEILAALQGRAPYLADDLARVADQPLRFDGDCPNSHSAFNHRALYGLEAAARQHGWIDTGFRTRFVEAVLNRWQARLKGMAPYQAHGYRLYVYEGMVITVSAVAETDKRFPYPGAPKFVDHPRDVARRYEAGSGFDLVSTLPVTSDALIKAVEKHHGSISKPTANSLGLQVGELRKCIECYDLQDQVNRIRKQHKRRPAQFRSAEQMPDHSYLIYERRLPAGY